MECEVDENDTVFWQGGGRRNGRELTGRLELMSSMIVIILLVDREGNMTPTNHQHEEGEQGCMSFSIGDQSRVHCYQWSVYSFGLSEVLIFFSRRRHNPCANSRLLRGLVQDAEAGE